MLYAIGGCAIFLLRVDSLLQHLYASRMLSLTNTYVHRKHLRLMRFHSFKNLLDFTTDRPGLIRLDLRIKQTHLVLI